MPKNYHSQLRADSPATAKAQLLHYIQAHYPQIKPHQAAALLATMQHESGFKPDAVGDKGTAHGAFQWRGDRFKKLQDYVKSHGGKNDLQTQLDFAFAEMGIGKDGKPADQRWIGEGPAGQKLLAARDVQGAVQAMKEFERYRDVAGSETHKRIATAHNLLPRVHAGLRAPSPFPTMG